MDLLDFESSELYFDQAIDAEAEDCIEAAAREYGSSASEPLLMRAYFLEPQHPVVLVALYRFFYYQHRYPEALIVAERVLLLFAGRLGLPACWQDIEPARVGSDGRSLTELRFYLLALKGAAYLELRLGRYEMAIDRLRTIEDLDDEDRLGAAALLRIAEDEVQRQSGVYRLRF